MSRAERYVQYAVDFVRLRPFQQGVNEMSEDAKLPSRSARFGVGKEIGGAVYVHRSYAGNLGGIVREAVKHLPEGFDYCVVKFNYVTNAVSFISVEDFDTADEPTVGDIVTVKRDGEVRKRRQPSDPEIYHHKWLFVADDYAGFDVQQSRQRSSAWLGLDNVDRKRIGRKSYWDKHVAPRIGGTGDNQ